MKLQVSIQNYRCFADSNPAKFVLQNGIIAFVGPNNSGKSNCLRFFYEFRKLFAKISTQQGFNEGLNSTNNSFSLQMFDGGDLESLFSRSNNRDMVINFEILDDLPEMEFGPDGINKVLIIKKLKIYIKRSNGTYIIDCLDSNNKQVKAPEPRIKNGTFLYSNVGYKGQLKYFFEIFSRLSSTLYIGSFRNILNIGTNSQYFDISIGESFITEWANYKSGSTQERDASYQLTQEIKNIFNFKELEINASNDNRKLIIGINGKSYWLSELGSGLSHFIIVLINATLKKRAFIMIDEPELNLHPTLQLDFLTTLATKAEEGILFSTHTLGLARSSADLIYTVMPTNIDGESKINEFESTKNLAELLGELNFSGYRELGFKKVLLVEGVTEVRVIQQFLRKLKKDHEVLLLPLGGSAFINSISDIELEEIRRITPEIFALVDSEKNSEEDEPKKGHAQFIQLCTKLGIKNHMLKLRSIENYLTDKAIKLVFGEKYTALSPYESLDSRAQLGWSKRDNYRIAKMMDFEEIKNTDLGEFLIQVVS